MSLSLGHRGARLVLVTRRRATGDETWWSPFFLVPRARDWRPILAAPLALLGLTPREAGSTALTCGLGGIAWRDGRWWSTIVLSLDGGSARKRQLVVAALLRAARYGRPDRTGR